MRFCTGGCKDAQEGRKNSAEHTNSTLRFWMQCDTINRKLNIKQQVPFIVCRAAEPSGALERVKGKRAQIPHDLVTVIRESAARVRLHRSLGISPGRRRWVLIFQPGNLPAAGYGGAQLQITRNWLYRKEPAESTGSFCVAILHAKRPRFLIGVFCCAFPCHATFSIGKEANT